jgi:hypothetical protein
MKPRAPGVASRPERGEKSTEREKIFEPLKGLKLPYCESRKLVLRTVTWSHLVGRRNRWNIRDLFRDEVFCNKGWFELDHLYRNSIGIRTYCPHPPIRPVQVRVPAGTGATYHSLRLHLDSLCYRSAYEPGPRMCRSILRQSFGWKLVAPALLQRPISKSLAKFPCRQPSRALHPAESIEDCNR